MSFRVRPLESSEREEENQDQALFTHEIFIYCIDTVLRNLEYRKSSKSSIKFNDFY